MESTEPTYSPPTLARYKPLVLVVQSTHFTPTDDKEEFDAMLTERGNVVYTRSRLITSLASLYTPTDIYLDSVIQGDAKWFNTQLNNLKGNLNIQEYPDGPRIAKRSSFRYNNIREELIGLLKDKNGSPERSASSMADYTGLISMLSIFALHGSEIKIMPYDFDSNLVNGSVNGNIKSQGTIIDKRDDNFYDSIRDSDIDDVTRILFTGQDHKLNKLRESSLFDSYFMQVGFVDSAITVFGVLPYEEGVQDPDEMESKITKFLREGGLEGIIDINFVPRQLAVVQ